MLNVKCEPRLFCNIKVWHWSKPNIENWPGGGGLVNIQWGQHFMLHRSSTCVCSLCGFRFSVLLLGTGDGLLTVRLAVLGDLFIVLKDHFTWKRNLTIDPRLPASIIFLAVICMTLTGAITLTHKTSWSVSCLTLRASTNDSKHAALLMTPSSAPNLSSSVLELSKALRSAIIGIYYIVHLWVIQC